MLNLSNGARFTSYAIGEKRDSGEICLNGVAARLSIKGDIIIIFSYCYVDDVEVQDLVPKLVYIDANNAIIETKRAVEATSFEEEINAHYCKSNKGYEAKG